MKFSLSINSSSWVSYEYFGSVSSSQYLKLDFLSNLNFGIGEVQLIYFLGNKFDPKSGHIWLSVFKGDFSKIKNVSALPKYGVMSNLSHMPINFDGFLIRIKPNNDGGCLNGYFRFVDFNNRKIGRQINYSKLNGRDLFDRERLKTSNPWGTYNYVKKLEINKKIFKLCDIGFSEVTATCDVDENIDLNGVEIYLQGFSVRHKCEILNKKISNGRATFFFKLPSKFICESLLKNFPTLSHYPSVMDLELFISNTLYSFGQIISVADNFYGDSIYVYPGCESDLIDGFINLDRFPIKLGNTHATLWEYYRGLLFLDDNSVDGITISHMLMYLPRVHHDYFLRECFRVLKRGGVLRVTEDNSNIFNSSKSTYLLSPTTPLQMRVSLENLGFEVFDQEPNTSLSDLNDMMRTRHMHLFNQDDFEKNRETGVYFIEGVKPKRHYALRFGRVFDFTSPYINDLANEVGNFPSFTKDHVVSHKSSFVADPFLFYWHDSLYCFYESRLPERAAIAVLRLEGDNIVDMGICLSEEFHLSFPNIFEIDGCPYLMPECSESNQLRLYKSTNFPLEWQLCKIIFSGEKFIDSSTFYLNGVWYIFSYVSGKLRLYYSYNILLLDFAEHPQSPICSDIKYARPAGRVHNFEGTFYRFSQNCVNYYGEYISMHKIIEISPEIYKEELIDEKYLYNKYFGLIRPWNNKMHHVDFLQDDECGDFHFVFDGTDEIK